MKFHSFPNRLLLPAAGILLAVVVSACQQTGPGGERGAAVVPSPAQTPPAALTAILTPNVPLSPSLPVTPTAVATRAATVTPTVVATRAATVMPPAAPVSGAGCPSRPVRGFGKVYSENPNVARQLGCPLEPEKGVLSAELFFQQGYMFWRSDTRQIYAVMNSGRWAVYPDTWTEADPTPVPTATPPAGLAGPVRGLGKVWRERKEVRDGLGWATGPERGFDGAVQPFDKGTMLWSDGRFIFALFSDGTWLRFEDTFRG